MKDKRLESLGTDALLWQQGEKQAPVSHDLYSNLCNQDTLQSAYKQTRADYIALGLDPIALELLEGEGIEDFLQQIGKHFQARTYLLAGHSQEPSSEDSSAHPAKDLVRVRVVEAALAIVLSPLFPGDLGVCEPEPEKAIK